MDMTSLLTLPLPRHDDGLRDAISMTRDRVKAAAKLCGQALRSATRPTTYVIHLERLARSDAELGTWELLVRSYSWDTIGQDWDQRVRGVVTDANDLVAAFREFIEDATAPR